jgi:hypothetical protein
MKDIALSSNDVNYIGAYFNLQYVTRRRAKLPNFLTAGICIFSPKRTMDPLGVGPNKIGLREHSYSSRISFNGVFLLCVFGSVPILTWERFHCRVKEKPIACRSGNNWFSVTFCLRRSLPPASWPTDPGAPAGIRTPNQQIMSLLL